MNNPAKLRWGILGTAQIARKNWRAIGLTGNATVTAVASRDLARSRRFIADCQAAAPMATAPEAVGSYEALLDSPDVDAVYVPLPTGLRKAWVLRAAAAGKHVVCEKPCAIELADLDEMLSACRRHRVQFMDGVMFMHSRRLGRMREALDDQVSVGQIRRITSAFSFCGGEEFFGADIRARSALEPHGCLGDLGWYCIRFSLWAMNWRLPRRVAGRALVQHRGPNDSAAVPTDFTGELLFDEGVSAGFHCSFIAENQQWGIVSGAKGYLEVRDFVLPFLGDKLEFDLRRAEFSFEGCDAKLRPRIHRVTVAEPSNSHATAQETNLFRAFSNQVLSGILNETWPDVARKTQQVMNACADSALADGKWIELGSG